MPVANLHLSKHTSPDRAFHSTSSNDDIYNVFSFFQNFGFCGMLGRMGEGD